MVISLSFHIPEIKKAETIKDKFLTIIELLLEPFSGLKSLFYLGFLLILYGLFGN